MFQGPKRYIAQICISLVLTCSMETVQQNGRFTLFSSKFHSNIYSILFDQTMNLKHFLCSINYRLKIEELNSKTQLSSIIYAYYILRNNIF